MSTAPGTIADLSSEPKPVIAGMHRNAALERRARLSDRRRSSLRRRTVRLGERIGVLLAADVAALLIARLLAPWLIAAFSSVSPSFLDELRRVGPLSSPGRPASLVFWFAMLGALAITGAYRRHRGLNTPLRLIVASLLAISVSAVALAAVTGLPRAILQSAIVAVVVLAVLLPARAIAELFLAHVWPKDGDAAPAIVVGPAGARESEIARAVTAGAGDYRIASHHEVSLADSRLDARQLAQDVTELIDRFDAEAVILTELLPERCVHAIVEAALAGDCVVLCPPRAMTVEDLRPQLVWHHDQPLLEFSTPALQPAALLTKRVMDVIGSLLLLTATSPLFLVIAIGVKLDSPGSIFFAQDRAGLGGRRFRMLKFRTMREDADKDKLTLAHLNHTGDARLFKIRSDPRVTHFGGFLRRWSLDELPQLWNVLRGDMSLIGPRPFFEADFPDYEDHHFRRLDTKPGITGLWQVSGRSDVVAFEDVVFLDRQYIEQWSFWLDLSILLRTMPSVFRRTGAY